MLTECGFMNINMHIFPFHQFAIPFADLQGELLKKLRFEESYVSVRKQHLTAFF